MLFRQTSGIVRIFFSTVWLLPLWLLPTPRSNLYGISQIMPLPSELKRWLLSAQKDYGLAKKVAPSLRDTDRPDGQIWTGAKTISKKVDHPTEHWQSQCGTSPIRKPAPMKSGARLMRDKGEVCDFCGSWTRPIFVHGHYQCGRCHRVIAECCSGENQEQ